VKIDRKNIRHTKCDDCDKDHEVVNVDIPPLLLSFLVNEATRATFLGALASGDSESALMALTCASWLANQVGDTELVAHFDRMADVVAHAAEESGLGLVERVSEDEQAIYMGPLPDRKDLN